MRLEKPSEFFRPNYRKPSELQYPIMMSLGKGKHKNGGQGMSRQSPHPTPTSPAVVMSVWDRNLSTLVGAVFDVVSQPYVILFILESHRRFSLSPSWAPAA